ncbi:hypothetical protein F2Q69_00029752 [Brassica cretica]|uniref:Uncharacterized protein n=1 Tax=Brassica cretica TaxID=69181 RepID=A0A8S9RU95_BRACR|nr:hypothetical protein F2Q69_00029752 [Brassica cretica]
MSAPKYQMSALETYLNWCGVFDMTNVSMETNVIAANLDNKSEALSVSGQWTTRIRLLQVLKDMDKSVTDKEESTKGTLQLVDTECSYFTVEFFMKLLQL